MTSDGSDVSRNAAPGSGFTGDEAVARLDDAWSALTAPGAPYEMAARVVNGVPQRFFVNGPQTLQDIWQGSRAAGARDYLVFEDERLSYERAHEITDSLRVWLAGRGIAPGDRVAIAMRNYPEWLLIYWACVSMGVVVVCLNAWWVADELAMAMDDAQPRAVFCDAERLERLAAWSVRPSAPCLIVAVRADAPPGAFAWDKVLAEAGAPDAVRVDPDSDACILYTSGTTGKAKGARLTHRGCVNAVMGLGFGLEATARVDGPARTADAGPPVALVPTPLFHVTASNSLAVPVTAAGGVLVLMRRWRAGEALRLVEAEKVTIMIGVPIMLREILQNPGRADRDLSSLSTLSAGGAPMPPDLVERFGSAGSSPRIGAGYGMTETSGGMTVIAGAVFAARPASCGRALPTFDVQVVDEAGAVLPQGQTGELCIRGPGVISGYVDAPGETADAIRRGWLHTGDIARIDADGFIFIVDRKKDMILRGGENVYCAEVEAAFYKHPEVLEACAFSVADEALGEEVGIALVLRPDAMDSVEALRAHALRILARYKAPRYIWVSEVGLPRNASGKFLRRDLQRSLAREDAV